jgi:hypothetical protein
MIRSIVRRGARSLVVLPALAALLVLGASSASAATTTGSGTYHVVPASQPFFGCLFVGSYGNSNVYYCAA